MIRSYPTWQLSIKSHSPGIFIPTESTIFKVTYKVLNHVLCGLASAFISLSCATPPLFYPSTTQVLNTCPWSHLWPPHMLPASRHSFMVIHSCLSFHKVHGDTTSQKPPQVNTRVQSKSQSGLTLQQSPERRLLGLPSYHLATHQPLLFRNSGVLPTL